VSTTQLSAARDLARDLRRVVRGEVRFDEVSRALYSTDASIYEIEPIGVVLPRDAEDVQAVIEETRRAGVPLLPRGGGTSLAGQAVGHAVVLDFSKFMRGILEVNVEGGWTRVQPGLVRNELAAALAPAGDGQPSHHRGDDREQLQRVALDRVRENRG
jgi:FAD/FMN-containing dehydrogenase